MKVEFLGERQGKGRSLMFLTMNYSEGREAVSSQLALKSSLLMYEKERDLTLIWDTSYMRTSLVLQI